MKKCMLILSLILLFITPGLAGSSLLRCSLMPQKLAMAGAKCITSQNQIFMRGADPQGRWGWQDTGPEGKIWADPMVSDLDQIHAEEYCQSFERQQLPSQNDFALAESHGFREILRDMKTKFFWSSTVVPNCLECRFEFSGREGKSTYFDMRDNHYKYDSVRCLLSP